MNARRIGGTFALVVALALVLPLTATAATPPASAYHGTWDSADVCGELIESGDVTGVWNVNLKDDGTAVVSVRIFEYGRVHAAWGGNWVKTDFEQQVVDPAVDLFSVKAAAIFGMPIDAVFTLGVNGTMTYELAGYCALVGSPGRALIFGTLRDD